MKKDEAIGFYHNLMRFGIKPGLDRINCLLDRIGNPQNDLKFVHVAGTNGKGSVCTEISHILKCAGYKTGLYTSPYVIDFCERIQINNSYINDKDLCFYTDIIKKHIDELNKSGVVITEFEAITATAFLYFKDKNCDIVVLETGLGGRYDATNAIKSNLCSVITSISLDHTAVLGDSVTQISYEKCGIFKKGCPITFSDTQPEDFISVAVQEANNLDAQIYISQPYFFNKHNCDLFGSDITYHGIDIHIPFPGIHQVDNSALVISCIEILNSAGFNISDDAIKAGIENSFIPSRTEIICKNPLIILDGCHNPSSVHALENLIRNCLHDKKILGLTAMMRDKDINSNIEHIAPLFDKVITSVSSNTRSASADALSDEFNKYCDSISISDYSLSVDYAFDTLHDYDALIVFGSLYFASDVRELLLNKIHKGE